MPWYITIILGVCFLTGGVIQWGYEHTIEKHSHTVETRFLDRKGEQLFSKTIHNNFPLYESYEDFSDYFFNRYKIVKKTKKEKKPK